MNIESVEVVEVRNYCELAQWEQDLTEHGEDSYYFTDQYDSVYCIEEFYKTDSMSGMDAILNISVGLAIGIRLQDDLERVEIFNITDPSAH